MEVHGVTIIEESLALFLLFGDLIIEGFTVDYYIHRDYPYCDYCDIHYHYLSHKSLVLLCSVS